MEKELLELLESDRIFHGECSYSVIEELVSYFKDRQDASVYLRNTGLYGYMRVREYLTFFASLTNNKHLLEQAVEAMHLADIASMKLSQCTESQKVRVLIARLILLNANTCFMVEPLRDLEESAMKMVISWMANEIESGRRIISVSPSLKEICLCPGDHYYLSQTGISIVDQDEPSTDDEGDTLLLNKLSVKAEGNIFLFNPEEIDYIEANEGKCYVYVRKEGYVSQMTLDELEQKLKSFGFYRCHRSYLVNIQKVTEIVRWTRSSYSLRLANYREFMVPLSKTKIQELKDTYQF